MRRKSVNDGVLLNRTKTKTSGQHLYKADKLYDASIILISSFHIAIIRHPSLFYARLKTFLFLQILPTVAFLFFFWTDSTDTNTSALIRFYRTMLCIRGTSHGPVSVRLSICPSQAGVLLKRLNVGSQEQHHTIAQGL